MSLELVRMSLELVQQRGDKITNPNHIDSCRLKMHNNFMFLKPNITQASRVQTLFSCLMITSSSKTKNRPLTALLHKDNLSSSDDSDFEREGEDSAATAVFMKESCYKPAKVYQ